MDIKSKNNRVYFAILCALIFFLSSTIITSYKIITYKTVDEYTFIKNSDYFNKEVVRYAKNLNRYFIYFNQGKIFDNEKDAVTDEDIEIKTKEILEEFKFNENIILSEYTNSTKDIEEAHDMKTEQEKINKLNEDLLQLEKDKIKKLEEINKTIINEKKQNFEEIKDYLEQEEEFAYIIENVKTSIYYSNLLPEEILKDEEAVNIKMSEMLQEFCYGSILLDDELMKNSTFNSMSISDGFKSSGISGRILVPVKQSVNSDITSVLNSYSENETSNNNSRKIYLVLCIFSIIGFTLIFSYCFVYKKDDFKKMLRKLYSYYCKFGILFKVLFIYILFNSGLFLLKTNSISSARKSFSFIILLCFIIILIGLTIKYLVDLLYGSKNIKAEWEIVQCKKYINSSVILFRTKDTLLIIPFILVNIGIIVSIICLFLVSSTQFPFYLNYVLIVILLVISTLELLYISILLSYSKIAEGVNIISSGNYDELKNDTGIYSKVLNVLCNINNNLKTTINEKVKSEKLKSELISNVSHDLKTPLTSIINYVELIKKLPNHDEKAVDYINVIDKKVQRLNILIEDLFEAAKLTSGDIELHFEPINIVSLLNQAIGELSEKIAESSINIKVTTTQNKIMVNLDGKKVWRVFENLIENILKYSDKDTRAYINIEEHENNVEVIFRNISKYELDFKPEELFERFKRGDDSRKTEGSGLGLSISKNIVELHGGDMKIFIDGDLFKIIITFKKL